MLNMLKLSNYLLIACIGFLAAPVAMATENFLSFFDVNNNLVGIYEKNDIVRVTYGDKKIIVDMESKNILSKMDSMTMISKKSFLVNADQFFWSFVRLPSRISNGTGYCGAGFEDFVILFSISKSKLSYIDKLHVQSCVDSFSIGVDSIKDVNSSILFSPDSNEIEISQEILREEKIITRKMRLKATSQKIETRIIDEK